MLNDRKMLSFEDHYVLQHPQKSKYGYYFNFYHDLADAKIHVYLQHHKPPTKEHVALLISYGLRRIHFLKQLIIFQQLNEPQYIKNALIKWCRQ